MTNSSDRQTLLALARAAVVARVSETAVPVPDASEVASRLCGAFVTLHRHGELRGCIGHVEADEPLGRVIVRCAVAAATSDPRFPAVSVMELPEIDIELSLLGPLEPISTPDDIDVGRHGLVVELGWHRGLLLPQVATQWNWDREGFIAATCRKAGLRPDAWLKGAKVWRFEAEVFGEDRPSG
jgi:AmmeMemoRadiSam system protein A